MKTYAIGAYEEQQPENFRGVNAIQVMTVHQAKGLEWPIVFIPCLKSDRFPSKYVGRKQEWYVPRKMFEVRRYEGELEDERRLFYVAMARARDALIMSFFKRIRKSAAPSPFVEEIASVARKMTEKDTAIVKKVRRRLEEAEIQTFSAGEIITYHRCPHMYRLREMWGYQPGLAIMLGYGKSLHNCLRCVAESARRGEKPEIAVRDAMKEFHLPYAYSKLEERTRKVAQRRLLTFVKSRNEDIRRIEEVEARLEFPLERATITGRVDVIMKGDGKEPALEVRDYKTSDDVTTSEHSSLQIRLYSMGLRSIGRPIVSASLAYLNEGRIKDVSLDDDALHRSEEIARENIKRIIRGSFAANPGSHCTRACDFPNICRYCQDS